MGSAPEKRLLFDIHKAAALVFRGTARKLFNLVNTRASGFKIYYRFNFLFADERVYIAVMIKNLTFDFIHGFFRKNSRDGIFEREQINQLCACFSALTYI